MKVPAGKLSPPPLGLGPLLRPRPLEALSRGVAETPVTLLSGPAGSGKTLLASSWAQEQHNRPPVAWLSLDATDDDPSVFWRHPSLPSTEPASSSMWGRPGRALPTRRPWGCRCRWSLP